MIIAAVIIGRAMIGAHFAKKFGKRPPPGIIVTKVIKKEFYEKIELVDLADIPQLHQFPSLYQKQSLIQK